MGRKIKLCGYGVNYIESWIQKTDLNRMGEDRIDVDYIYNQLKQYGEDVTTFKGNKQFYNCKSRILVATISKAGVGFDHPKMDSLILASDVEGYFIQYLGRVFRREDVFPLIFDLVDNFQALTRHYYTRKKIYEEHGGVIKKFNLKNVNDIYDNLDVQTFNDYFGNL